MNAPAPILPMRPRRPVLVPILPPEPILRPKIEPRELPGGLAVETLLLALSGTQNGELPAGAAELARALVGGDNDYTGPWDD